MIRFDAGDVVRVPFPYVERNVRRHRPALVLTRQPLGLNGLLIWAVMITNAERERWPGDVEIGDYRQAGLPVPSIIRTAKIATLESAAAERLGQVSAEEASRVAELVSAYLAG